MMYTNANCYKLDFSDVESLFVFTVKTKFSCSCLCFMNHCVVALRMSQRAIWPTPLLATLSNRPPTRNRWETSNTYGFIQLWFSIFRRRLKSALLHSCGKYFINMLMYYSSIMYYSYNTWSKLCVHFFVDLKCYYRLKLCVRILNASHFGAALPTWQRSHAQSLPQRRGCHSWKWKNLTDLKHVTPLGWTGQDSSAHGFTTQSPTYGCTC